MFRIIGTEILPTPDNLDTISDDMCSEQKMNVNIRKVRYHSIMKILKPNQTFPQK